MEEVLRKRPSPWQKYKDFKRDGRPPILRAAKTKKGKWTRFLVLCGIAAFLLLVAFFGFIIAPYDPLEADYTQQLIGPSAAHWFGTDNLGRDVLSRILYGASTSFSLTFLMIAITAVIGTTIGIVSGFFGGILDTFIMRFTDILLAFPDTVFAIAIVGMMGPGLLNTIMALGLVWWTKYARVTRGMAASLRTRDFITQARFGGASTPRILLRYVFPNIFSQVLVMATQDIGGIMLSLAGLSFLGLASQPPTPEWGYMLYESKSYLQTAPWIMLFTGFAIFITVIVFNLLGDSLRDILDPKER